MLSFIDHTSSPPLLYELLCYFSAIGDSLTSLKLQEKIQKHFSETPQCILKQFEFYLAHKIYTISFDCFMNNSAI